MYDVQDVVEYIITYSEVKDYGISNLKLQKILFSCILLSSKKRRRPYRYKRN